MKLLCHRREFILEANSVSLQLSEPLRWILRYVADMFGLFNRQFWGKKEDIIKVEFERMSVTTPLCSVVEP